MLADWTGRPDTIDEVVATMRRLDVALPDSDGLKWFNYLYLTVTEAVLADAAAWQDWPFLQQFDVVFERLYFDAIVHWERDARRTPHAWRPLLRTRHDVKRAPIQFALAVMNAHINHDLPIALNTISVPDGRFPSREGARYNDFLRVNDVLARVEASVRPSCRGDSSVRSTLPSENSTTFSPCGRWTRLATQRGRTERCSGIFARRRSCNVTTCPHSIA